MKKSIFKTDLGWGGVVASDTGITRLVLPKKNKEAVERELKSSEFQDRSSEQKAERILNRVVTALQKYFSGKRVVFDLPLDIRYYTAFQRSVWKSAAEIPSGETRSYGWIAQKIKNPKAARAVGQAMGANPVPVIIP
jgi:O6-methylguanine-DNA--protein-cysteine methyltransferase